MNSAPTPGPWPYFPVLDGWFSPIPIVAGPTARRVARELADIGIPEACTVWLRGSRLEDPSPHPRADLDLAVVVDNVAAKRASWMVLSRWAQAQTWPVDLMAYTPAQVACWPEVRLLLVTRSLRVAGPQITFEPVAADDVTMRAHARRHAPHLVRNPIDPGGVARVAKLKQVTRSYGVWGFDVGAPFSRDIATCLGLAHDLAPEAGRALARAWRDIDSDRPIDVADALGPILAHRWFQPP